MVPTGPADPVLRLWSYDHPGGATVFDACLTTDLDGGRRTHPCSAVEGGLVLTSPRPVVAVAVMQAVRDQLSQACLPPPVRPPADREPPDGPEPRTPSVQERDVQLRQTWLSRTGSLDVLHVVYQHSGFPEPLEYRVEMDLQVEDSAEPETFAGAVEGEARLIIEEINTCVDESLLAMLIRVRGQLCWGAVLS